MINDKMILNLYEDRFSKKKLSTQLLYGDKFKIIKKFKDRLKIKTTYDNYIGYIAKKKFPENEKRTHKISVLKANLYSQPRVKSKLNKYISFCSYIKVNGYKNKFYNFGKYWIKKRDVTPIKSKIKIFDDIKIFDNIKYKWGGNSHKGIDCSALVQIFFKFNNTFCPRDTKDQVSFFKTINKSSIFKKNNLIYWKGHVAICLNNNHLIHAYGPKKKVVTMNIKDTVLEIKNKSNLEIISIKKINDI
tara:strand:+ start:957 stop:1694 length:738 start_codon:yes stop_codon:yes gene_type:complete